MDDTTLPVPQPVQASSSLPAPEDVPVSSLPAPAAAPTETASALPPPEDTPATPVSNNDDGVLSRFKNELENEGHEIKQAVAGPGTFLGPIKNSTADSYWQRTKDNLGKVLDTSLIVPNNAITPEDKATNPHLTAAAQGVGDVIQGLTTPSSIALILSTAGLDALPTIVEKALAGTPSLAKYAPNAVKATKAALTGLSVYFTADQISSAIAALPEISKAVLTGQTDKAIRLTTGAFINGAVGVTSGREVRDSLHEDLGVTQNKAFAHDDYRNLVKERQKTLQIAGGMKDQIADLGRTVAPDVKDREWATEYVEAGKDRDILKNRQAETAKGPTPSQQIDEIQGKEVPFNETTLHRAEAVTDGKTIPEWIKQGMKDNGAADAQGRWFTDKQELLDWYKRDAGPNHVIKSVNVPNDDLEKFRVSNLPKDHPARKYSADPENEFFIPRGLADKAEIKDTKQTWVSPGVQDRLGFIDPTAAEPLVDISKVDTSLPVSQQVLELQAALKDAEAAKRDHVITPEERAQLVQQQDPDRKLTPKQEKAINTVSEHVKDVGQEAIKRGLLKKEQLRDNFVPHELPFDDTSNPLKARIYDTHHDLQQAGLLAKNKDYYALTSDYIGKMWNRMADVDTTNSLLTGKTNDGAPLAVPGGFVEGQRVSTEGPKFFVLDEADVHRKIANGQMPDLIRSGRVIHDPVSNIYKMDTSDYVKADNLYQSRPIGPTPIPDNMLAEMTANGSLDKLVEKDLIYKNPAGKYVVKEPLWARTPLYIHPDVAQNFNSVVKPMRAEPTSFFGKAGKIYDDTTGNMKSLLLSFSPFHRVTESLRMMEALGIKKGGKLALQQNLPDFVAKRTVGLAPKIDYFNLEPWQEDAIRNGIVISDPRGHSMSNVEEGLSAGEGKSWGAQAYRTINRGLDKGLEKIGVPADIRGQIPSLQDILTKNVFGPQGMITHAKFEMYKNYKPDIAAQILKDHPDWSTWEVDKQAGQLAAQFANDKFGGLNHVLLGRTVQDARILRRLLLAPDFLESTGRSVLDLANPYGGKLASKMIQFNIAHMLTAAGINYALHHDPNDNTVKGAVDASHLLDHPYQVVSPDNKTAYGLRTTEQDFAHMIRDPREFAYDRFNPLIRAGTEIATQRNQYGRKESLYEASKSLPKAALPIQLQTMIPGLAPNTSTEPSRIDQFVKSIGVQAKPNRTDAEQKAIDLIDNKLQGQAAREGPALVKQQLKFAAEDKLRAAYQMQDPDKKKAAIDDAKHDIANLLQRRIIAPDESKKIQTDAKGSRLKSIFNSLTPPDALDVWDKASDDEKRELEIGMRAKYSRFREDLTKRRENINSLNEDDQNTFDRFREASRQATEIRERPEPAPPPKKTETKKEESSSLPAPEKVPTGMISPGNIDLNNRPVVQNADGSKSTEFSVSFTNDKGQEVLVPTVVDGKFLTPDGKKPAPGSPEEKQMFNKAWQHYEQTGQSLGTFDSSDHADAYAEIIHNRKQ